MHEVMAEFVLQLHIDTILFLVSSYRYSLQIMPWSSYM